MIAVIATIDEEWFPYERNDRWTIQAIAAIVAIIWKPAFQAQAINCLTCTYTT